MPGSLLIKRLGCGISELASRRWLATSRAYAAAATTSGDEPSVSGGDGQPIFAACVLQRMPLVRSQAPTSHAEHLVLSRQRALETGEIKDYPQVAASSRDEGASKSQQQDLRTFNPVPSVTAADASGDVRSMRRALSESLYLVVRSGASGKAAAGSSSGGGGEWSFPAAANTAQESISDTAQRALLSTIGRSHPVFFVGNAPMAHLRALPQGTTFFMLAQAVDDPWDIKLAEGASAREYAWVTKRELLSGGYLADARLRELLSKML
ncbi:hypothetical protein Agub_g1416 [Astrephomene gubernaculifera]|uniref:Ribosomal protein L46 N-terminal domain-containing protein n=1 Tax=Astrephomene gubernaculifera TaxID=47775 RepID=A0AAD3DFD1_9CHLO|nr:hypothetical protein Agub_g1416 [Astrephomene gubernaculifera]